MKMSPAAIMAKNDEKRSNDETPESDYEKGVKHLYEKGYVHSKVPKKYILPASERPTSSTVEDLKPKNIQLPIIDFADLLGPNRPQALQSLAYACEQYGFFQVVNHCISEDDVRRMIDVSGRFFDLPFEERKKYMTSDMRASVRCGTSFSQTKDTVFCWRDFLKLLCHPLPHFLPHWPASPVDFQQVVFTYAEETKHLFLVIMEAILESLLLGIMETNEEEEIREFAEKDNILRELENGSHMLVANFYPPCPQPELTLGMPPHSDYGFLTLLLQDEVEGLQIQFQDKWVTVQPIPNAFVVNIGDHLEIYSNGKYKSVLHRVLVNEVKSRVSVASLHSLPFTCTVKPLLKLINEANPKRYLDTDFDSFLSYISTKEPKEKSFLDSRKLTHT